MRGPEREACSAVISSHDTCWHLTELRLHGNQLRKLWFKLRALSLQGLPPSGLSAPHWLIQQTPVEGLFTEGQALSQTQLRTEQGQDLVTPLKKSRPRRKQT